MPRSAATVVENNFKNGLVTEASGLNFPENACTETFNCIFNFDGSVIRRRGLEFEHRYTTKSIPSRLLQAMTTYIWKNVGNDGNTTLQVVQVGNKLYFYKMSGFAISDGALASTVTLTPTLTSLTPGTRECQFNTGNGLLFVTHPWCEPFYVEYDSTDDSFDVTTLTLKIRDLEGVEDPYEVDERPRGDLADMGKPHFYNLLNQGWRGAELREWEGRRAGAFDDMPSNSDLMWTFKDLSDKFVVSKNEDIDRVMRGNTPAPKGHFILDLFNQDREEASGINNLEDPITTNGRRPSTCAFFAGRVFYGGIPFKKHTSRIYFTQIVERDEQYEACHQQNDPTSEDVADLLPTDGGFIAIPEAGTIYRLFAITGALLVFAANGVWSIGGSTGLGFTANDYVVSKISSIATISATSFVDVGGFPAWWNAEGIYVIAPSQGGSFQVTSLTDPRIKRFMNAIPLRSKQQARGHFNLVTGVVQWLYRSTEAGTPDEVYDYDRILNYNMMTGAFYPWTLPDSDVRIHGISCAEGRETLAVPDVVTDELGNDVTDDAGEDVTIYNLLGQGIGLAFKYLVSYEEGVNSLLTFAEEASGTYTDWLVFGDDTGYESYFISGYKVHGEAIKKFQANYVNVYSRNSANQTMYYFQGLWDYATSGTTGRWSSRALVTHNDADYANFSRRLKVRGHGKALQFKVASIPGVPFDIIGWSNFETGNQLP